jgi:hypothetical protein
MSEIPWSDPYTPSTADDDPEERANYDQRTFDITIRMTCSGWYADPEQLMDEIAQSLEWLYAGAGQHHAILGGTWEATPEVQHWDDK